MKMIAEEILWRINLFVELAGWIIVALVSWEIIDNSTEVLVVIIFILLTTNRYRK